MKKIVAFICFLALLSWGAKGMFENANKQVRDIHIAAEQAQKTDELYSMLPSGEGQTGADKLPEIAPATGDTQP